MKTLTAILAVAFLAAISIPALAGGRVTGVASDPADHVKTGHHSTTIPRHKSINRGGDGSINWGDGRQHQPISDQAATGVSTKRRH